MLPHCQHREFAPNAKSPFFCRHGSVHAANHIVDESVCRICTEYNSPCERPHTITSAHQAILSEMEGGRWHYFSTEQLVSDVRELLGRLPSDVGAVAGIPRSGLLPASMLAMLLHVPLFEISNHGVRSIGQGERLDRNRLAGGKLLVVDDSIYSGIAMEAARVTVGDLPAYFAALYPKPDKCDTVDLYARPAPFPHLFEWNLFNCSKSDGIGLDFDGVLCEDWTGGDEDQCASDYATFLAAARPRWLPRRSKAPLIVTARLEKHRTATVAWLDRHRVEVDTLLMGPWESGAARQRDYSAAKHKGIPYRDSRLWLFVESDDQQAREIAEFARKPVLCPCSGRIYGKEGP